MLKAPVCKLKCDNNCRLLKVPVCKLKCDSTYRILKVPVCKLKYDNTYRMLKVPVCKLKWPTLVWKESTPALVEICLQVSTRPPGPVPCPW